jgi:hypothetical protein
MVLSQKSKVLKNKTQKNLKGGNDGIPLISETSGAWHKSGEPQDLAVDTNVGINEYVFGRTTPDNKFIVSTGLVDTNLGVKMVGSGKKLKKKVMSKKQKDLTLLNKIKKSFSNISKSVSNISKTVVKKVTNTYDSLIPKKKVVKDKTKAVPKKKVVKDKTKAVPKKKVVKDKTKTTPKKKVVK